MFHEVENTMKKLLKASVYFIAFTAMTSCMQASSQYLSGSTTPTTAPQPSGKHKQRLQQLKAQAAAKRQSAKSKAQQKKSTQYTAGTGTNVNKEQVKTQINAHDRRAYGPVSSD